MGKALSVLFAALFAAAGPAEAQTVADYRHLVLDGHPLKWGKPEFGTGARVTYALAGSSMSFAGARNCATIRPLDRLLATSRIPVEVFDRELRAALRVWESAANLSFVASRAEDADILIGAQAEPEGFAFANVEYDRFATGAGPRSISRSVVCLNPERRWKVGFDGDLEVYDLRYTLIHELGHAIGLDHPAIAGQLMAYRYGEAFRVLQPGDIRGIESLYGSPPRLIGGDVTASGVN